MFVYFPKAVFRGFFGLFLKRTVSFRGETKEVFSHPIRANRLFTDGFFD